MKKKKATKSKTKKKTKSNNPNGRPKKLPLVDALFSSITQFAAEGKTNAEIAEILGVAETTIYQYKNKYKKFSKALADGKAIADDLVEQALFARAIGFVVKEPKPIFEDKKFVGIEYVNKQIPPDPTCLKMWLINRRPDNWRDKKEGDFNLSGNIFEELAKALDEDE